MSGASLQTSWAHLLLASFADAGVRQVVVSPGSRSTPFAAAAIALLGLETISVVDERDAAFFALGQAKVSGWPSLLLCTSGTAGANYLPALLEAEASHTPFLALTADRPTELSHCHAPQTIDQVKLFGDHVRAFFELGAPDGSDGALRGLRRVAAQAVFASRFPVPGPVHLNARAKKPLEPATPVDAEDAALAGRVEALLTLPIVAAPRPTVRPAPTTVAALAGRMTAAGKGLVVAGPAALAAAEVRARVAELCRRTGYPLLAEAASQLRFCALAGGVVRVGALDTLGRSAWVQETLRPELVLQLGPAPTASGFERLLAANANLERHVLAPHGWQDPWSSATSLLQSDLAAALDDLLELLPVAPRASAVAWQESWRRAEATAWEVATKALAGQDALAEAAVARTLVESLPGESLLCLGNSLPIREVDSWAPPAAKTLAVWSQRGVSGIDGVVAGALGAASRWRGPGALLIGDVSFLHGLSGLACAREVRHGFVVLVVNNDGGRIFEQLPVAASPALAGPALDYWLTPHGRSFAAAAELFGLPYQRVASLQELRLALVRGLAGAGVMVVEATVPAHGAANENLELWRAVDTALAARGAAP